MLSSIRKFSCLLLVTLLSCCTSVQSFKAQVDEELEGVEYQVFDPKLTEKVAVCRRLGKGTKKRKECFNQTFKYAVSAVDNTYDFSHREYVKKFYQSYKHTFHPEISQFIGDVVDQQGGSQIDEDVAEFLAEVYLYETLTRECHANVKTEYLEKEKEVQVSWEKFKEQMDHLDVQSEVKTNVEFENVKPYCY